MTQAALRAGAVARRGRSHVVVLAADAGTAWVAEILEQRPGAIMSGDIPLSWSELGLESIALRATVRCGTPRKLRSELLKPVGAVAPALLARLVAVTRRAAETAACERSPPIRCLGVVTLFWARGPKSCRA